MDDQDQRRVRIAADGRTAKVEVDGHDIAPLISGIRLEHWAGKPPELTLAVSPVAVADEVFTGMARVTVGEQPEPGPAAAVFLAAVDAGELERTALARVDLLDGGQHEMTRAMLTVLGEWARGQWEPV
ncbi:hypothetical protein [Streptacidiphilus cavernicola]|uniref:Uncharacterized protein n=1 Tax=Streptacidiphilus cavernicola TaxID=3342716 RepID=A0ABV6VNW4_9ACTN